MGASHSLDQTVGIRNRRRPRRRNLAIAISATFSASRLLLPEGDATAAERPTPENPALALLKQETNATTEALSRTQAALNGGKFEYALNSLPAIEAPGSGAGDSDLLSPYVGYLKAEALTGLGRHDEALALLTPSLAAKGCRDGWEDPVYALREALRAELTAKKDPKEAATILRALLPTAPRLLQAIDWLKKARANDEARQVEVLLLTSLPETKEAKKVAEQLGEGALKQALGTEAQRLARIRALLAAHENERANQEANQLLEETKARPTVCELQYISGKALRKLRQYTASIKALKKARVVCASVSPDIQARATLLEINVRAIRGQERPIEQLIAAFTKQQPRHSYLDDALVFLAEVKAARGKHAQAETIYRQVLNEYPFGDQALMAAWRLAFAAIKKNDPGTARPFLEKIAKSDAAPTMEGSRARYWLARLLEKEAPEVSASYFRETVLDLSFYSWLALAHTARKRPDLSKSLQRELLERLDPKGALHIELPSAIVRSNAERLGFKLFAAGRPDIAEAAMRQLDCPGLSPKEALALAFSLDAIDAHASAQAILRARSSTMLKSISPETLPVWYAAYSRPYFPLVEKAAKAEEIEPLLFLALVREESTFDPEIVSWAGAVGLGQLMPATAVGAFSSVFRGRLDPSRLTDPELNLRLGARVLADGLRTFEGVEALGLGAYNAGASAVRRWLGPKPVRFERWVEEVSVKQTRRYIKRVTETWGIYRLLYDKDEPFIALPAVIPASGKGKR
ncbi:MAG: transglycosylase SLT domain-containing protein [Deltaproteobacteria bacterium]|nr:transglycosylase SLT domain-containing protein [Deltaproteobacteria bacterium]